MTDERYEGRASGEGLGQDLQRLSDNGIGYAKNHISGKAVGALAGSAFAPGIGTAAGYAVSTVYQNADKIIGGVLGFFLLIAVIVSAISVGREEELRNTRYVESTHPISADVLKYREQVVKEAEKNDSLKFVNLFLAVMMQESGGRAVDVFQCAESLGYGPQGFTGTAITTEKSIEHGVKLLSSLLRRAGVEEENDLAKISLAIQSYNMGSGFLSFANQNYGGYTQEAALEYQKIQSGGVKRETGIEELGPYRYGDAYYAKHVLRYYSYNGRGSVYSQIPRYYQNDYPHVKFGDGTIATSGCGLTSFAMVATYISGRVITPEDAVTWCGDRYYTDVGLSWAYFQAATSHFNLGVSVTPTTSAEAVLEALRAGKPVICSQAPGLFTSSGHLIVLSGIDEAGNVYVNDPNKANAVTKGYNDRGFDFEKEIDRTSKHYWIFG